MEEEFLISEQIVIRVVFPDSTMKPVDNAFLMDIRPLDGLVALNVYLPDARVFLPESGPLYFRASVKVGDDYVDIVRFDNCVIENTGDVSIPDLISMDEPEKIANIVLYMKANISILWDVLEDLKEIEAVPQKPDLDVKPYDDFTFDYMRHRDK
jgi:hypothetical protein